MKGTFHKSIIIQMMLILMLVIYIAAICVINFSASPVFFDADMYCDYRYAVEVWNHKSLFPEGWIFGNQLNAVSTPVIAALLYGMFGSPNVAMATACTIMAVLVVLSFYWLLKPVVKSLESRLVAILTFMSIVLYYGGAISGNKGWNLFFTMCSYYAGYIITAFLAFGCYLRAYDDFSRKDILFLALVCILSFGTGIQSIRQTVIMVIPLLAAECFRFLLSFRRKSWTRRPVFIAGIVTASNILGLVYVRRLPINQITIYGEIVISSFSDLLTDLKNTILAILSLLSNGEKLGSILLGLLCLLCIFSFFLVIWKRSWRTDTKMFFLLILLCMSVPAIAAIDILFMMDVRPRYYFMLFPFIGCLIAFLYDNQKSISRNLLVVFTVFLFGISFFHELPEVFLQAINRKQEECYSISTYLQQCGYTTVYSTWGHGEDLAIASDGELLVGYWNEVDDSLKCVEMLCDPSVYDVPADQCVYIFDGKEAAGLGERIAEEKNVVMTLLQYYPNSDTYVYTVSSNLMLEK